MNRPNILGVSGSLRAGSFNTSVLNSLVQDFASDMDLSVRTLEDIPLFNQDLEDDVPASVLQLREQFRAADGLIISSPEYNYGIPGVLKNALDWASRPYGQSSYLRKPVLIMTASPGATGGLRAHADLQKTFMASECRIVGGNMIGIGGAHEKLTDGRITDEATQGFIRAGVERLLEFIKEG